jgi:TonB family protein
VLGGMRHVACALMLLANLGGKAMADCEAPHALDLPPLQRLTKEAIDIRYRAYLEACAKGDGDLIDAQSTTYRGRIGLEVMSKRSEDAVADLYPAGLLRQGISGVALVVGIIDKTGKTSDVTLIGTSGYKGFDDAALKAVGGFKYRQPVTLDGVPVRAFKSFVIRFQTM